MQILSLIQSSAHLMIIPWFPVEPSIIFFFHFTQRSDESEENEDSKVNRKEEYKNGREKEGRENGNVNHHKTEQPSKKRKEDLPESKSEVKKPSPEKKKVCKPFDHHPLLVQNQSVLLMLKCATLIPELIGSNMIACVWYVSFSTWIRYLKMKQ